jgi:hypothetical protein
LAGYYSVSCAKLLVITFLFAGFCTWTTRWFWRIRRRWGKWCWGKLPPYNLVQSVERATSVGKKIN